MRPTAEPAPVHGPDADPDLPLILALQAGDDAALDGLMERYEAAIFRFLAGSLNDREDARELTQEVFVRVYFARAQFDRKGVFKAWLYRIAVNLLRDRLKSRGHRQRARTHSLDQHEGREAEGEGPAPPLPEALVEARTPASAAQDREALAALRAAISRLPVELAPAFVLCALQQQSYQECAATLGLSVKAVEMRIYKARKLLQKELNGA